MGATMTTVTMTTTTWRPPTTITPQREPTVELEWHLMLQLVSFKCHKVRVHIIKRERITLGRHWIDKRIIFWSKTGEEVGEHIVITERSTNNDKIKDEALYLAKVVGGRYISLLYCGEFNMDLNCAGLGRRCKNLHEGSPRPPLIMWRQQHRKDLPQTWRRGDR